MKTLRHGGIYRFPNGTKVVTYTKGAGGYVCYRLSEKSGPGGLEMEVQPGSPIYLIDAQGRIFRCEECEDWTPEGLVDTGITAHIPRVA